MHYAEKAMATHSSVLAWRIPGTGEPGGLPSMGSHRVGHNWSDLAAAAACMHYAKQTARFCFACSNPEVLWVPSLLSSSVPLSLMIFEQASVNSMSPSMGFNISRLWESLDRTHIYITGQVQVLPVPVKLGQGLFQGFSVQQRASFLLKSHRWCWN